ncbi:patatin-like phospholipase family protein [Pseudomonas putida]
MDDSGEALDKWVQQRRAAFDPPIPAERRFWGLALSGGGIRSATFCLGVIKALAAQKQLRQFDLMSTVSGGGYAGASLGKLFHESKTTGSVLEERLGRMESSWWLNWLRANGRYLTPSGTRDTLNAFANFGRNLLGIHIELAVLGILLACVLIGIDLLVWAGADRWAGTPQPGDRGLTLALLATVVDLPTVFILLVPLLGWAAVLCFAYWLLPAGPGTSGSRVLAAAVLPLAGLLGLIGFYHSMDGVDLNARAVPIADGWLAVAAMFLGGWLGGACLAFVLATQIKTQGNADHWRNQLTNGLGSTLFWSLGIVLAGYAELAAWFLAHADQGMALGPVLAVLAVALRIALPMISNAPKSMSPLGLKMVMAVLNLVGLVTLAALVVFWISVVHRWVGSALFRTGAELVFYDRAWYTLLTVFFPAATWAVISRNNVDFLNRSSLYLFYRARLIRAYLGASNAQRKNSYPRDDVMSAQIPDPQDLAVCVPEAQDDVLLTDYQPHRNGGPIHLLNVCVNQTSDPRGGIFNRDRKGEVLTLGSTGLMRAAMGGWQRMTQFQGKGLGHWMAISGAAVAPGLGATTRPGIAALLMMAGIRLGYWWDSTAQDRHVRHGKYRLVLHELIGRFEGRAWRHWFLSDGGHFDNTGAYALLREEAELIVLADCGADPQYAFCDLENLVRKARIDLDAEIVFQRPTHPATAGIYGSLADLASAQTNACLALARIKYRNSGNEGYLILVKPNLFSGMPLDLVNFKAFNPLFPQESTTDQFFSEAQWESYFQMGHSLGMGIVLPRRQGLATLFQHFCNDDGAVITTDGEGTPTLKPPIGRNVARFVGTGAVSATLSFGAVTTAAVAAWQALDPILQLNASARAIEPDDYKDIIAAYNQALGAQPQSATQWNAVASELLRVADNRCQVRGFDGFNQSKMLKTVVATTQERCDESDSNLACKLLKATDAPSCLLADRRMPCEPLYWVRRYDYGTNVTRQEAAENCIPPAQTLPVAGADQVQGEPTALKNACAGYTVYLQIYGPAWRDAARSYREVWKANDLGANVPPIEDVVDSARRQGQRPPLPHAQPTVLRYANAGEACSNALVKAASTNPSNKMPNTWKVAWKQSLLGGAPDKKIIEVWLPPAVSDVVDDAKRN